MATDARVEAAIKAGCDSGTPPSQCVYPDCKCRMPLRIKAALAAADRAALAQAGELVRELTETADNLPEVKYAADMDAIMLREAAATLTVQTAHIAVLEAALEKAEHERNLALRNLGADLQAEHARLRAALGDKT